MAFNPLLLICVLVVFAPDLFLYRYWQGLASDRPAHRVWRPVSGFLHINKPHTKRTAFISGAMPAQASKSWPDAILRAFSTAPGNTHGPYFPSNKPHATTQSRLDRQLIDG